MDIATADSNRFAGCQEWRGFCLIVVGWTKTSAGVSVPGLDLGVGGREGIGAMGHPTRCNALPGLLLHVDVIRLLPNVPKSPASHLSSCAGHQRCEGLNF